MALNVHLIRLLNGEELIGELRENLSFKSITIKNPLRIVIMPSKTSPNTPTIGFAPWAEFSSDTEFDIDKSHVLCIMKPIQEFVNQYNATFGGIITPQTSNIILPGG